MRAVILYGCIIYSLKKSNTVAGDLRYQIHKLSSLSVCDCKSYIKTLAP